ncbi:MAG: hypothetical protein ACT4O9_14930 [Blastocatellia bacterium]
MRVLGLCTFPVEAAATRFRLEQFVEPLSVRGIELTISPFLDSRKFGRMYARGGGPGKAAGMIGPVLGRIGEIFESRKYDLLFVQREAMFFGPAVFEWLMQKAGNMPMILDLDDATYVPYVSPSYGRLGSFLKFFGKTDKLIERAVAVTCGNRFIADYVESKGTRAVVIPTVVDTDKFCPVEKTNDIPVVGWIGTHSTFPSVQSLFPVIERLARNHRFKMKIVGGGIPAAIDGVEVENLEWDLAREIADFQSLDIGLYPIVTSSSANEEWLKGKSGFKAIQYFAVGVPFVMSPVGICAEIGEANRTHFNAVSPQDWYTFLDKLLSKADLRSKMGARGRRFSIENYMVGTQAEILARELQTVSSNAKRS